MWSYVLDKTTLVVVYKTLTGHQISLIYIRGVRKGCLPPYIFILRAEILGTAVRRDKLIRDIQISGNECKIC